MESLKFKGAMASPLPSHIKGLAMYIAAKIKDFLYLHGVDNNMQ